MSAVGIGSSTTSRLLRVESGGADALYRHDAKDGLGYAAA
jgi:hypothetical protein